MAAEDGPRLCGRMQVYSIFPVAYVNIPMDREILMYTDGETADLGEMGLYMHNVMSKYIKKRQNIVVKKFMMIWIYFQKNYSSN